MKRFLSFALAILSAIAMLPTMSVSAAENYNGGWALMNGGNNAYTVYTTSSCSESKGSVNPYEGITVLSQVGNSYHIEYSSANGVNGMKDGYVRISDVNSAALGFTCVATVNVTSSLYYGPSANDYDKVGTVSAGEHVAVIGANSPWAYVEYNTPEGRKRGHVSIGNLTCHNWPSWVPNLYETDGVKWTHGVSERTPVYAGPSEEYAIIGYVSSGDGAMNVYYMQDYKNPYETWYIKYKNDSTGRYKTGFVLVGTD